MKKFLLVCAVAASVSLGTAAQAQTASNTSQRNSRAAANGTISRTNSRSFTQQQRAAQTTFTTPAGRIDGVVARALRSNDPVQLLNPAAPATYGTGRDVTRHEVDDPYQRPQGIKLVTIEF